MTKKSEKVRPERFTYSEGDVVIGEPIDLDDLKGSDSHWGRNETGFSEGGPESGHYGHRGIPHYQGGSMARGAIAFGPGPLYEPPDHMIAYAEGESDALLEKITRGEKEALSAYSGSAGYGMNKCLRHNEECYAYDVLISSATEALSKRQLQEDTKAYRVVSPRVLKEMVDADTFQDDGFMSTTHNLSWAARGVGNDPLVELNVPAGTQSGYMQNISSFNEEVELLLQRGTQVKWTGLSRIEFIDPPGKETEILTFDVVGQAPRYFAEAEIAALERQAREGNRDRIERYRWQEGDLTPISEEDIAPIEEPESKEEDE